MVAVAEIEGLKFLVKHRNSCALHWDISPPNPGRRILLLLKVQKMQKVQKCKKCIGGAVIKGAVM